MKSKVWIRFLMPVMAVFLILGTVGVDTAAAKDKIRIGQAIASSFGSLATFQKEFIASAVGLFGSGYVWLTFDPKQDRVAIEPMKDAENPLRVGRVPLLGMDVWEHAYYLDYQNRRQLYVETFLSSLANWRFADANLESCNSNGAS